jgi:hypothetical protein
MRERAGESGAYCSTEVLDVFFAKFLLEARHAYHVYLFVLG